MPDTGLYTPLLVETNHDSFDDYIGSLSKTGKKNYKYAEKHNEDLEYSRVEYNAELINYFMGLWQHQDIRGGKPQWGFGSNFVEFLHKTGSLMVFAAVKNEEPLSIHFVEKFGEYVFCHPPLFDKEKYNERYIAKYMWFNLIKYCIKTDTSWIDLGGGPYGFRGTWKNFCVNREKWPKVAYKWLYVPKHVKDNPELQKEYLVAIRPADEFKYDCLTKFSADQCADDTEYQFEKFIIEKISRSK
jgi:hypothetical protein